MFLLQTSKKDNMMILHNRMYYHMRIISFKKILSFFVLKYYPLKI